ncbi:zinc finger protein ZFPM2-like isoform X2 [Anneissia japonica]|nr:zinc finger protein ZFPM2-like isoform X2 [Anneissia japonica]
MHTNNDASKVPLKKICICQFCHIQFRNPANLQVHVQHYCQKVDVSSSDTEALQKTNKNSDAQEFVCQLCRSTFSNHSNCETHMIKLHGETESNLCKFCTYIASNMQSLIAHMFQQHVLVYENNGCTSSKTIETTHELKVVNDDKMKCKVKKEIDSQPEVINSTQGVQTVTSSDVCSSNSVHEHLKPTSVDTDCCSSSEGDNLYQCENCSFKTHLQLIFDQHECNKNDTVKKTKKEISIDDTKATVLLSVDDVTTTIKREASVPQQNVLSCTACNITFKSIRNFSAHKTYYCANRQFANDLYIAKLQKRQRGAALSDDEPLQKRSKMDNPTDSSPHQEHSPESEIPARSASISIEQCGNAMPMLCLSRPTSRDSSDSDLHMLTDKQIKNNAASQEKPLDLSVRKSPPSSSQVSDSEVPLVRPTSLNVQIPRAIVLGYKCIECDILFHKQESLKVHKQYYCATRHQPSPQRPSPLRNSSKNGSLSRSTSKSPVSPAAILEKDDLCSSPGKMSPDSIQMDLQTSFSKSLPSNGESEARSPSPPSRISQPSSSAFSGIRVEHGRNLSSPRQADKGSPGNATTPTSSQPGAAQLSVSTMISASTFADSRPPGNLVMRYHTTPYHDTMVTSKDLQSNLSTRGQRKIYCVCGAVFRNYDIYVAHKENYCSYRNMVSSSLAIHTTIEQPTSQNEDNDKKSQKESFVCNICQNTFGSFADFKDHKCVSCVCPACPYVGSNLNQLQEHFKDHPGLLLDSASSNSFPEVTQAQVNAGTSEPARTAREGAKRRKSTTPHALHAKQARLDGLAVKIEKDTETFGEHSVTTSLLGHTPNRQSVITTVTTNPDNDSVNIINCSHKVVDVQSSGTDQNNDESLEFTKSNSISPEAPESPTESNTTGEWEDNCDRGNTWKKDSTITADVSSNSLNTQNTELDAASEHERLETNGAGDEDSMKSLIKKSNKSNAKLCRTCDLHFNNLSTFIAHRKYYCGASNQTTKI